MIDLSTYRQELNNELRQILQYWMENAVDEMQGGFYGSIDNENTVHAEAPKGLVLNARILWTFSAAFNATEDKKYLQVAERAYRYLADHFTDKEYGGAYWSVDASGQMLNPRKQVYGIAFYLYGISEYYSAVQQPEVLDAAIQLFRLIEEKSFDADRKGYFEAFNRDWTPADDFRLSDKDANAQKTMNTHLHIIEAYANLYWQWPDTMLKKRIVQLLEVFDDHMIDKSSGHLLLFFDAAWKPVPDVISYGHNIEAAWLLQQCAETTGDEEWLNRMKNHALLITRASLEGLDEDGGLWYEFDPLKNEMIKEKHWWPQAEAMLGFFNSWQISSNEDYLQLSINSWNFIKKYIRSKEGEWVWGVYADYTIMQHKDKAGFWKCPYHNSRACLEIIQRIGND